VPGEGRVGALLRAVCKQLRGPAERASVDSCEEGFLRSFTEQMEGLHDLLRQKPPSCSHYWDDAHLSRLTDDAVRISEFGTEDAGVMELDAVPEIYTV
jgi:hypothetical protein